MKQQLQQKLRELITLHNPELVKESEHIGDTGFYIEPELRHLLIALEKHNKDYLTEYTISAKGVVCEIVGGFNIEVVAEINLSIPLLDNEEEVLQGLIDILS